MVLIAFISFGLSGAVYGDVVWDESVDGDLSGDPLAPTSVVFGLDSNELIGSVQSPNDTRDFFTFTIPQNRLLTGIFLLEYEDLDNGGDFVSV